MVINDLQLEQSNTDENKGFLRSRSACKTWRFHIPDSYGTSFLLEKSTIFMAMFNSKLLQKGNVNHQSIIGVYW